MSKKILLILALGLVLRLITINQSLWLDEAIGAVTVRDLNIYEVTINFPQGDNHPPLYYTFLEVWSSFFGYSEIALRSLSVIFGLISILFTYKIAQLLWSKESRALLAALLVTTSQFHLYYSQEARMYMMATMFATLAIYYFLKYLLESKVVALIFFSASITALVFTDYVPVLMLPIFLIYAFFYSRNKIIPVVLAYTPLVVLGILWLPIFLVQSKAGAQFLETLPAWRDLAGGATLKQALLVWTKFTLGRLSFLDKSFYYTLLAVTSIPFVLSIFSSLGNKLSKHEKIVVLWLLFPLITGFLLSFVFPLFIYFRFAFLVPAFYLILSRSRKRYIFAILLVNFIGIVAYYSSPLQQRENWKDAVNFVESNIKDNEVVLFANPEPFAQYRYYQTGKAEAVGVLQSVRIEPEKAMEKTKQLIDSKDGIYYFAYLEDLMDPNSVIQNTIEDSVTQAHSIYNFDGVGQIYYYKK